MNHITNKALLTLTAALTVFLCGCASAGSSDISKRVIVHGIGVDKADEGYEVSLQIFSPNGSGSDTPLDPSQANMKVITGKGSTIYQGVRECEYILGSHAFIGHNRLIVFGKSLYGENMEDLLMWFRKENENYLGVTVAFAEGSAKDILSVPLTDGSSTIENLNNIVEFAEYSGTAAKGDLLTLINQLSETGGNGCLPILSVVEQEAQQQQGGPEETGGSGSSGEEQTEQYIKVSGTAVLKDKKFCGSLDEKESAGLLWLTDEMDRCFVTLKTEKENFNAEITNDITQLRLRRSGEGVRLEVSITAEVTALESVSGKSSDQICSLAEKEILSQCGAAASKLLDDYKADGLNIEKLMKFFEPKLYDANRDDIGSLVSSSEVAVTVQCSTTE